MTPKGTIPWNKGKKGVQKASLETRKKLSLAHKGNKHALGSRHTDEWKRNKSEQLKKQWKDGLRTVDHLSGENHWNWKGGITPINKKIRLSKKYSLWRTKVFERDDYTCVLCGIRGCYLEVDHLKPFSLYPNLRFDMDNGRTLCLPCHKNTNTYFWKHAHVHNNDGSTKD